MPHRGLDVEGTWVTPHLQRYHCEAEGGLSCGEILCRPQGAEDPSLFFSCLSTQSHFSVLAWLLELQATLDEQLNSHVSINVSNMILAVQPVRERFLAMLWAAPRPAVLEFTEVYRMPPSRTANSLLHEIRLIGHRTALDDFGSRDVDMSLLYDFDFDIVKIDRSQIVDLTDDRDQRRRLADILRVLDSRGRRHVVEGIEDEETYAILMDIGFRHFQGFLFDEPKPLTHYIATEAVSDRQLQNHSQ